MKITITIIFAVIMSLLNGCKSDKDEIHVPESYLGHLDIILDTATVRALAEDNFIRSVFAISSFDTITIGVKKSYDFYLMGQENFLHISQARGFYESQAGGLNVILQSRKPAMKDSLMETWKKFTDFALEVNPSVGEGYTLYEIMPLVGWTNIQGPRLIPFLSTYSSESYATWGIWDSARSGITMKTFIKLSAGAAIDNVLFKKIDELYINATARESDVLKSALLASGYKEEGGAFTHKSSAKIFVKVNDAGPVTRISKIKFKLTRNSPPMEKTYNRLRTSFNNDEGWFYFE